MITPSVLVAEGLDDNHSMTWIVKITLDSLTEDCSYDHTVDEITVTDNPFVNGDQVNLSAETSLPTGLSALITYYAINVSGNSFQLSLTDGGAAVLFTSNGVGAQSISDATRIKYWSSIPCTISDKNYDGTSLIFQGLAEISQEVDIISGGGIASVGNTSVSLNEILTAEGLHEDFYPQSSVEWINRTVQIGIIYNDGGTLTDADITWLYKGTIDDYSGGKQTIDLSIVASREIEQKELPQIIINGNNYPNAPDQSLGVPIPILYGVFSGGADSNLASTYQMYAPTVCTDKYIPAFTFSDVQVVSVGQDAAYGNSSMLIFGRLYTQSNSLSYGLQSQDTDVDGTITFVAGKYVVMLIQHFTRKADANTATDYQNVLNRNDADTVDIHDGGNEYLFLNAAGFPSGKVNSTCDIIYLAEHITGANLYYSGVSANGFKVVFVADDSTTIGVQATKGAGSYVDAHTNIDSAIGVSAESTTLQNTQIGFAANDTSYDFAPYSVYLVVFIDIETQDMTKRKYQFEPSRQIIRRPFNMPDRYKT